MANTRAIDRVIKDTARRLEAVRHYETWALTSGEKARAVANASISITKGLRQKSNAASEARLDRVWEEAAARYERELAAAQAAKAQLLAEEAAAKVAKKASGWW